MNRKALITVIGGLVFLLAQAGCGRKGPPFLPEEPSPPQIERLTGQWEAGRLTLSGWIAVHGGPRGKHTGRSRFRLYHAWYPLEHPPCQGCPLPLGPSRETDCEVESSGHLVCEIPIRKDQGIHIFRLRAVGPGQRLGPPSDVLQFKVQN